MILRRLFIATVVALAVGPLARAEFLVALTSQNQLFTFDSTNPGVVSAPVSIDGLAAGEMVLGIDYRPATGQLYALTGGSGMGNNLYVVNPLTGATVGSAVPLSVSLDGAFFGVDFNPVPDRLRVTSDSGQNYRINVDTGAVIIDGALNYAAGDLNEGTAPQVVASAYTNNQAGATSTQLFNIDVSVGGSLVLQSPPNDGILSTIGLIDTFVTLDATFDISGQTGIAYLIPNGVSLFSVNLATGMVTFLGDIAAPGFITGLAAPVGGAPAVVVPAPAGLIAFAAGAGFLTLIRRRRA